MDMTGVRRNWIGVLVAAAAMSSLLTGATGASAAGRTVPQGFAGVAMDPWQLSRVGITPDSELAKAAASGVESVRFPLYWSSLELQKGDSYRWSELDAFMEAASRHRISLIPVLLGAPTWAADPRYPTKDGGLLLNIPSSSADFAAFASKVVSRYRSGSSFWSEGRQAPLKPVKVIGWQVWNEPDIYQFWPQHLHECQAKVVKGKCTASTELGFAPTYLPLLRAASSAIHSADPTAKVILASLANVSWVSLGKVYAVGGSRLAGKKVFDIVATNTFTADPANLIQTAAKFRTVLKSKGDSTAPLIFTEYSWAASRDAGLTTTKMSFISVSASDQARNLGTAFDLFVKNRVRYRIAGAYWHTWASPYRGTQTVWDYTGLRSWASGSPSDTPALATFTARALKAEGCKAKVVADSCSN